MRRPINRKEFLRLITFAGFSLYLPSCFQKDEKSKKSRTSKQQYDSSYTEDSVESLEKVIESNNVTYLRKKDEGYEEKSLGFNLRIQKYPLIIALCKNTQGVSEAIKLAKKEGLKVAVKSGGHSFESFSSIDNGLQINLTLMNSLKWQSDNTNNCGTSLLAQGII